jgi:hypothetical protein
MRDHPRRLHRQRDTFICRIVPTLRGRPTIYLDQKDWSTLANAIFDPGRVQSAAELEAAHRLIELAKAKRVVLPVSAGHMQETCQDSIGERRYRRALTMLQLSAGWRLTDPLALRRRELRTALSARYHRPGPAAPPAVTLDPDALFRGRGVPQASDTTPDPDGLAQLHEVVTASSAHIDTLLDTESVPAHPVDGWVESLQSFADFLRDNPRGRELLRQRTWAKFVSDSSKELVEESWSIGITPAQMSEWTMQHAEADVRRMPSLGLFREVIHEKLSDTGLQWESNDLTDMIYLTAASGYCDQVVGERSHTSHINNSNRRLGRVQNAHRNIRTLLEKLQVPVVTDSSRPNRLP